MLNAVKEKQLVFKVNPYEFEEIHAFAKLQGKTLSSFVIDLIREQMENWEDEQDVKAALNANEPGISWNALRKEGSVIVIPPIHLKLHEKNTPDRTRPYGEAPPSVFAYHRNTLDFVSFSFIHLFLCRMQLCRFSRGVPIVCKTV